MASIIDEDLDDNIVHKSNCNMSNKCNKKGKYIPSTGGQSHKPTCFIPHHHYKAALI